MQPFEKYDRVALPVTDTRGVLVGIITVDDVLDVAEQEATEDIQKLGGMEALDAPYFDVGLLSMIRKRGGWLSALFLGEMLTATAMGYFEDEIAKAVVLALFVPLIISSGGNSGSQATSIIIRSLALREVQPARLVAGAAPRDPLRRRARVDARASSASSASSLWAEAGLTDYGAALPARGHHGRGLRWSAWCCSERWSASMLPVPAAPARLRSGDGVRARSSRRSST